MPPPTATGWTNSRYSLSRIETGRLDGDARASHRHVSAYGFLERGQLCAQVTAHHRAVAVARELTCFVWELARQPDD
jgi:hypothetical protein